MLCHHYFSVLLVVPVTILKVECTVGTQRNKTRPFLKYYEFLSYDHNALDENHMRSKRATQQEERTVSLEFLAYRRKFELILRSDASVFADDFEVISNDKSIPKDISFVYSGALKDEDGSYCYGSIINGHYEGLIQTSNGTFYVEYEKDHYNGTTDSYIYHEADIDYSLMKDVQFIHLASKPSELVEKMKLDAKEQSVERTKRSVDLSRTTCMLYLTADYLFYQTFGSVAQVISQIAGYMKAVNAIYEKVDFDGIKNINFKVKMLNIIEENEPSNYMNPAFIGPEHLLTLHSETNWNKYCLSYLITDRDYSGTLGIAWDGRTGNNGGICSKFSKHKNISDREATLNTGLITIQKYGQYLPPRVIHIALAHELGHSLGSPHDGSDECSHIINENSNGNYLMYRYATDGTQYNNDKFSPCSIKMIGNLLRKKKDQCFTESGLPICGNRIVESGEECDVGLKDNDACCYGANASPELQCRLRPGKQCSPSEGLCCSESCYYKSEGENCQNETECTFENNCTGVSAKCPKPTVKDDNTLCNFGTRICTQGVCRQSICLKFGLEQCDCESNSIYEMCQLCCKKPGDGYYCKSTSSAELEHYFKKTLIQLPPGSPCGKRQGYCDKFHICRLVDADGPIARLKNSFLKLNEIDDIATWMKNHWWAILIIILTISAIMAGTVFIFGRTVDSEIGKEKQKESRRQRKPKKEIVYWETEVNVASAYYQQETKM
ncbi:disintegrin and metalloproteinase domain-containing protein 10-like [Bombina bombina]|uniref:disintegrin and metalloproteinase domain-containing protein 10-like n=1 Tax=Bombina bombina TaxID=8345 RepID=UPI00235A6485|nr:disintegrin and metalloproteinase domain-containing protein 10-like [Bombina bombina]